MAANQDRTFYSGPLQLIRIDDAGKCHLQENAAAVLNQIKGKLAVVGIAGLYRTGKSFLLNRLLGLQEGFDIGPTVNPCTKGLWIWGQPVQMAADYHCIFIDTEGLGSTQRTASCDMQIFSLCVLLSSYFIYNSMGAIDEQAIDDLHLVLHLAKHIHVKSKRDGSQEEKASELSSYFPQFLWVLRDFHLQLVDERGSKISERDYLENSLRAMSGQEEKNKLRDVIRSLFRDRECCTVVRPVAEEADLRNINRMPYESLRPQFRTQVEAFVKKVYTSLKPKKIDGNFITGPMFANLCSEYCKAINGSVVPTIQSAWTSVVQHQLRICLKDAVQGYRSEMNDKAMQHLPMEEEALRDIHKAIKKKAMDIFLAPKFDPNDSKFREFKAELSSRIKQLLEHVIAENRSTSERQCERIAKELYSRHIENKLSVKGSYQSFHQLMEDWDSLRRTFSQKAQGPAKNSVLTQWLFQRMTDSVQRLWDELKVDMEDRQSSLQRRLGETEAQQVAARDVLEEERNTQSSTIDVAKRQWLSERIEMERQLEETKRAAEEAAMRESREKAQLLDAERTLKDQVRRLQERFHESEREARSAARDEAVSSTSIAEISTLKNAVVSMMSELRTGDMEKKQLEMKAEHEKQLIGLERKFQRQLMEARRKNDGLIENLRQTYEDEVDQLKSQRSDLIGRAKDLERELTRGKGEVELQQQRLASTENELALQRRFVETAQRQSELVITFLERCPGRPGGDLGGVREELNAISAGGSGVAGRQAYDSSATYGRGDYDGNRGNMPYGAANASVFRNMPGI